MIRGIRASGVLLHVSSLPSEFGIGDLGPAAHSFVDLLAQLNQQFWSVLPLNPTSLKMGNSPYRTESVFAGNPLLISPQLLSEGNLLSRGYAKTKQQLRADRVDFRAVQVSKKTALKEAYSNFRKSKQKALGSHGDYKTFTAEEAYWLEDYARYKALRKKIGKPWHRWPDAVKNREPKALAEKAESLREQVEYAKFVQYVFFSQWKALKDHCGKVGVKIIGDMPFYADYDSADVWAHPELFKLNKHKTPKYVGGVPPDYFSKTGQLWGNPVYDWKRMKQNHFEWWMKRIGHNLRLCDVLRLDHFRGFVAYWQVQADAKTAEKGRWVHVPHESFFRQLKRRFPSLPFIAEDLGDIDDEVVDAKKRLGVAGMRVLVFAFDGEKNNPHLPRNYLKKAVAYTGTHDTNTVKGWFTQEASAKEKKRVFRLVGKKVTAEEVSFEFVKAALASKANLCIIPLQDVLSLGSEARMNKPARKRGNWGWQVTKAQLENTNLGEFGQLTVKHGRGRP